MDAGSRGIGNHGGGPSRIDLQQIAAIKERLKGEGVDLIYSTPEAYFQGVDRKLLPRVERDLNPAMVGCYTSQVRIKQKHRELENTLFSTEKMACAAEIQTGAHVRWDRIAEAERLLHGYPK